MTAFVLKPGLNFMTVRHDADCPTIVSGRMSECVCEPVFEMLEDETSFVQTVVQTRQQRRAAERAAAKALRKAAKL